MIREYINEEIHKSVESKLKNPNLNLLEEIFQQCKDFEFY